MKTFILVLSTTFLFVIAAPTAASEDKACGAKRLGERWRISAPAGWVVNDFGGSLVDGYMFLPPGKSHTESDRALVVVGFTKTEAGRTFDEFRSEARRRYVVDYPGGPPLEAVSNKTGGTEVWVYRLKPGLKLPYPPAWETHAYIEEPSCFIVIYLNTRTESAQSNYEADLAKLVRSLRRR